MAWIDVQHLFAHDDGSLPDVFVKNLSRDEILKVYSWVMSLTEVYDDPYVWSLVESRELKIRELYENPVQLYLNGDVEPFRHGLKKFSYKGIGIPQLSIAIEGDSVISFDYRMGVEWGEEQVDAFFKFLAYIKTLAPNSSITHSAEGDRENCDSKFELEILPYFGTS